MPATPAAPALVVPERRLWALDGTMLTTRTEPAGPLVTFTGPTLVRLEYCTVEDGWQHLPPERLRDSGPLEARHPGAARSLRAVCTAEGGLVCTAG